MIGKKINTILNLEAEHSLYFYRGDWFHYLNEFPGLLIDSRGYVKFNNEEEFKKSEFIKFGKRLHVYGGISSMPSYIKFNKNQLSKINQVIYKNDNEFVLRQLRESFVAVRNQGLVNKLKKAYNNTCQICSKRIKVTKDKYYSEVHHIKPLGKPHNGPDNINNMICVCPNCHVELDFGAKTIDLEKMNLKHSINLNYIEYHNTIINKGNKQLFSK